MEITARGLWTLIHGMGFGALYLLACSGALMELFRITAPSAPSNLTRGQEQFLKGYLVAMAVLAWSAVLTGAYVIYPWYRAIPRAGVTDLSGFPQRLLLANSGTAGWHSIGMEWKEHIAWFAPISITMVAYVFIRYGRELSNHKRLRTAVLSFAASSFLAAGVAGFFGAMINKYAPVQGGGTIHLSAGAEK
ncbi:MAG: hypothetical protein ABSF28_12580 [Terracidiphilus sp.]|jgi:hypothetical protein